MKKLTIVLLLASAIMCSCNCSCSDRDKFNHYIAESQYYHRAFEDAYNQNNIKMMSFFLEKESASVDSTNKYH